MTKCLSLDGSLPRVKDSDTTKGVGTRTKTTIHAIALALALCGGSTRWALAADAAPPNIVLFLSDDHGYLDSSVYGSRVVKTPTMDRLAAQGVKFTRAFVGSPSCAPCRAILYTGLMSARNGAEANHSGLRPGVKTLPGYLKELGYQVVLCGKRHLKPESQYGFEFVKSVVRKGPLNNDLDTAAVAGFLARRRDKRPLCLVVCSHSPHVYWPPNDGYDPREVELPPTFIDTPETRAYRTQYYTDITLMDRRLGEVYDAVSKSLGKNTLFLYTSDHGAQWPFAKWNLYDSGIRVPLLAVWPGKLPAGGTSDILVSFADFLPTFIELAGGDPPKELDGKSFAPALRGEPFAGREELFATHSGDGKMNVYPMRCLRTQSHKYILNLHPEFEYTTHIDKGNNKDGLTFWKSWERTAENGDEKARAIVRRYHQRPREELYDLRRDPFETNNLAGDPANAKLLGELRGKVRSWMQAQHDEGKVFDTPRLLP